MDFLFIRIYIKVLIKMSINIKFPLQDNLTKNVFFLENETSKDALTSNLLLLLLTQKGERYYDPEYGTNLLKFVFEQNDSITENEIERDLKITVKKYIPQLNIDSVVFYNDRDNNGDVIDDSRLNMDVKFTFNENVFSEQGSISITF